MLDGKYIIKAINVIDDDGIILKPFYMGERHIDLSVLSHDIHSFDDEDSAKKNLLHLHSRFDNATFIIQKVSLDNVAEIKIGELVYN